MSQAAWPVKADPDYFPEALKWFLARVPMTKDRWLKLSQAQRRKAFTVAGVARADVLNDVFKGISRAIAKGTTLEDFKKEFGPKLREQWAGSVKNPAFRLEVIFRNNLQLAYSAGRWAQQTAPGLMKVRPFGMLDVILDNRVSTICEPLAGTVLPMEEFAKRGLVPPLHHMCRTIIRSLRRKQAERQAKFGKPVPNVTAQEGWGLPPDKSEWKPDLAKYPPDLRKKVEQHLEQAEDIEPMPVPPGVKFVATKTPEVEPPPAGVRPFKASEWKDGLPIKAGVLHTPAGLLDGILAKALDTRDKKVAAEIKRIEKAIAAGKTVAPLKVKADKKTGKRLLVAGWPLLFVSIKLGLSVLAVRWMLSTLTEKDEEGLEATDVPGPTEVSYAAKPAR